MSKFHEPVLLQEAIDGLRVKPGRKYIDATLGGGGHSFEILRMGGVVLGIDVDKDAITNIEQDKKPENLIIARGNFRDIDKIALLNNFNKVAGIIFDLGVSSHQIETFTRGFSFQNEGPLDMRMDQDLGVRALDLIKILTKEELYEIFNKFGEESNAWAISNAIVSARKVKPIETTKDLVDIIGNYKNKGIHRATKVFQALRIIVNDELNALQEALPKAIRLLEDEGRLIVISFHSLEDRIVKKEFLKYQDMKLGKIITEKPLIPSMDEIARNRRSRSAKLRIFERLKI